jgi:hypothetical protein
MRTGWFSCRSACYLAAGRPVVVQDTGFSRMLPVGNGILTFDTADGVVTALAEVEQNYRHHAESALAIANSHFDSDQVLNSLIADVYRSGA